MVNDPILKCVVVELSNAIEEVELRAERHTIIKLLDETMQRIANLGVPHPVVEPVQPLRSKNIKLTKKEKTLRNPLELKKGTKVEKTLKIMYLSNKHNKMLKLADYYNRNKYLYKELYGGSPYSTLSSCLNRLVQARLVLRTGKRSSYGYWLSEAGIALAKELVDEGSSRQEKLV